MFVPVATSWVAERIEERQTCLLPRRISLVVFRPEPEELFAREDDALVDLPRPYSMFFELADLLLCAEMPATICAEVLSMAKLYWRHETCQYFSGLFS